MILNEDATQNECVRMDVHGVMNSYQSTTSLTDTRMHVHICTWMYLYTMCVPILIS